MKAGKKKEENMRVGMRIATRRKDKCIYLTKHTLFVYAEGVCKTCFIDGNDVVSGLYNFDSM